MDQKFEGFARSWMGRLLSSNQAWFFVMALGLLLRFVFWENSQGIFLRDGSADVDGYLRTSQYLWKWDWVSIGSYRPTQLLYPILLSPIHLWNLNVGSYVLFLHLVLAFLTLHFTYRVGVQLLGRWYGFLLALFIAIQWPMIRWFHWMWTETLYYCVIAGFLLACLKAWRQPKNGFHFSVLLLSCLAIFLVKPEGFAFVVAALSYWGYCFLNTLMERKKALAVVGVLITVAVVGFSASFLGISPFRQKVMSHIHVAHGLWLSTRTVVNAGGKEQDEAYVLLGRVSGQLNLTVPSRQYHFMSKVGLQWISQHPFKYLWNAVRRAVAVLFPGLYWYQWGWTRRILDDLMSFGLALGFVVVWMQKGRKTFEWAGLSLVFLSALGFVSFYLADGDLRFRTPLYQVMVTVAMAGLLQLVLKAYDKMASSMLESSRGEVTSA